MAGKRARVITVRLRQEPGRVDEQGRPYWLARWTEGGKRPSEPIGYATAEDAEDQRVLIESRLRLGMPPSGDTSPSATVDAVIKAYIADIAERTSPEGVITQTARLAQVGRLLGRILASELTTRHLSDYVARRRRDAGTVVDGKRVGGGCRKEATHPRRETIQNEVKLLRRAWRVAKLQGVVRCDPPDEPSWKAIPDDARPLRRLLEHEVAALVAKAERPELARLIEFMAWCPRRPIAILALRRRDCVRVLDERLPRRDRQAYFTRDKGGISRGWSPLTEPALTVLLAQLQATGGEPDDLVWPSETGRAQNRSALYKRFQRAVSGAGLADVQPYDLRRFGAVRVYRSTADLHVTAEYTGHKDVRTLLRYLSAERGLAEDLAETISWSTEEDARAKLRIVE